MLLTGCVDDPVVERTAADICAASGVAAEAPGRAICVRAVSPYASTGKFAESDYAARRAQGDDLAALCFNVQESVAGDSRTCAYRCLAPTRSQTVTIPVARQCQPALPL